jgi:hypothetical protein
MDKQLTSTIMMVRPVAFRMNEQTVVNNFYQKPNTGLSAKDIQKKTLAEFDNYVDKLRAHDIEVIVIEDTPEPSTPDSIFPNNWISFHSGGQVVLYPMFAENRRLERRDDVLGTIKSHGFTISEVVDYTAYEKKNMFLEGTGSMILDREHKISYAAVSERTDSDMVEKFAGDFGYRPVVFEAFHTVEGKRLPIYHTNVMMSIANHFAIICLDSIDDEKERQEVERAIIDSGKEIIELTEKQVNSFAGNMLQVKNRQGKVYLIMSTAAHRSLTNEQLGNIEKYCPVLYNPLDTIEELGGGSARCMMAEVFLPSNQGRE